MSQTPLIIQSKSLTSPLEMCAVRVVVRRGVWSYVLAGRHNYRLSSGLFCMPGTCGNVRSDGRIYLLVFISTKQIPTFMTTVYIQQPDHRGCVNKKCGDPPNIWTNALPRLIQYLTVGVELVKPKSPINSLGWEDMSLDKDMKQLNETQPPVTESYSTIRNV